MKNTKYYWKVVRVLPDGRMFSAIVKEGKYCVEYKIGETSKEVLVGNGLLVFNGRKWARKFIWQENNGRDKFMVLKVKAVGCERTPVYYYMSELMRDDFRFPVKDVFPTGTCAFSKILVVEKSR